MNIISYNELYVLKSQDFYFIKHKFVSYSVIIIKSRFFDIINQLSLVNNNNNNNNNNNFNN